MTEFKLTLNQWIDKLKQFSKIYVGFSGGLDSTVLLHLLATQDALQSKLHAVHIHHGLSIHADHWLMHCESYSDQLKVPFIARYVQCDSRSNIEECARNERYQVFSSLLHANDVLVLGHHAQDQAETLLLQLLRGCGVDGLASMPDHRELAAGSLIRPLLECCRFEIEAYAKTHALSWVEDESNQDMRFSRNLLRKSILPQLQKSWPALVKNFGRTAAHCRDAKINLSALAYIDCPQLAERKSYLSLSELRELPLSRLKNVLRVFIEQQELKMPTTAQFEELIQAVLYAKIDAFPQLKIGERMFRRYQDVLYCVEKIDPIGLEPKVWINFPKPYTLREGEQIIAQQSAIGCRIHRGDQVEIRFRVGGERFNFRNQNKSLKTLMQEWRIPPWERASIPLVYVNGELAAIIGYAASDSFYCEQGENLLTFKKILIESRTA